MEIKELRKHAKEITKKCEERGYTFEDAEMLCAILKDEISQCEKATKKRKIQALAQRLFYIFKRAQNIFVVMLIFFDEIENGTWIAFDSFG